MRSAIAPSPPDRGDSPTRHAFLVGLLPQPVVEGADRWQLATRLAMLALGAAALLGIAGLPPIDLHGPLHRFHVMDPACGMTRAVRALARGQLERAVSYNPASPLLVAAAAAMTVRAAIGQVSGRWVALVVADRRLLGGIACVAVIALWVNQQAHASLLLKR